MLGRTWPWDKEKLKTVKLRREECGVRKEGDRQNRKVIDWPYDSRPMKNSSGETEINKKDIR